MSEPAAVSTPAARLLVVDDNENNRDMLQRRLQRKGYAADTAEDGRSALALLGVNTYDAVLLDVMMPGMSGNEVLLEIRTTHSKTELPVIMATAKSDSADIVEALAQGANDYVTKPINFPVLVARIESHLSTKKEAKERSGPVIDVSLGIESGTVLDDRYEILQMAGEGGFAQVYEARQISTGQIVAFKHARPERVRRSTVTTELQRFEREMQLIGKLRHPNIVRLIDSGSIAVKRGPLSHSRSESVRAEDSDTRQEPAPGRGNDSGTRPRGSSLAPDSATPVLSVPYMVMEFLEGESLAELMTRRRAVPYEEAVAMMLPVMSALSAAHEQGIVHRDVKPQNILIVTDHKGEIVPKVLDFGIAKLTGPDAESLTLNESFIGTPEYSAPEQARGKKDIDPRADQFSLGAILYRLLSGRAMYEAESFMGMVSAVVHGEFRPLEQVIEGLPQGVADAVSKSLSLDRRARFSSMDAFARALMPHTQDAVRRRWADHFAGDIGDAEEADAEETVPAPATPHSPPVRISSTTGSDTGRPTTDETGATLEVTYDRAPTIRPPAAPRSRATTIALIVIGLLAIAVALLSK